MKYQIHYNMEMTSFINFIIVCVAVLPNANGQGPPPSKPQYSTRLETQLRQELFTSNNYEVLQRPMQRVLNIKNQALSLSGYFSITWMDPRLKWSNSSATTQDYTNIMFLFSNEVYVWRPALTIENSITDIGIISDESIPMRILSEGLVIWNPSGIYEVSCESDITFYPLDTQECTIKISSWAYTQSEVQLEFGRDPVDLNFYTKNGEWELLSATGSKSELNAREGISFSSLKFSVKLRRRPMFHIINTLFPVALVAVLIAMVFKLPVDSGEKIGFALTVLLAYAVYLTIISDNIPSTSVAVSYLSVYLVFILTLGAMAVLLTISVLSIHFKSDEEEIPSWVQNFTRNINCKRKTSKVSDKTVVTKIHVTGQGDTSSESVNENDDLKLNWKKMTAIGDTSSDSMNENNDHKITWPKVAAVVDQIFFTVYIFLIVIVTGMLFLTFFINYYA